MRTRLLLRFLAFLALSALLALPAFGSQVHNSTVIVLDGSGSMGESMMDASGNRVQKMDAAKVALSRVLKQVQPDTHIGILLFPGIMGNINWIYPLGSLNYEHANSAVSKAGTGGSTPLGRAIKMGTDVLLTDRDAQHGVGRYQLLVVTDGEASDPSAMEEFAPMVVQRGIRLDVIGVAMPGGQDHTLARFAHSYQAADDAVKLESALKKAIVVEAGGNNAPVDFTQTLSLEPEVVRAWLSALTAPLPNQPLGENPPAPSVEFASASKPQVQSQQEVPVGTGCNSAGSSKASLAGVLAWLAALLGWRRLAPVPVRSRR